MKNFLLRYLFSIIILSQIICSCRSSKPLSFFPQNSERTIGKTSITDPELNYSTSILQTQQVTGTVAEEVIYEANNEQPDYKSFNYKPRQGIIISPPIQKKPEAVTSTNKKQKDKFEKVHKGRLAIDKHGKQKFTVLRQKFPIVWFIILSALLGALLIYYAVLSSEQGTGAELALLFLIIPLLIPWSIIVAKVLAPMLGWPVFWTVLAMFAAVILLFKIFDWIAILEENARLARTEKARQERLKRDPATY